MGMLYDAVYLYAGGLDVVLAEGYNETHGKKIIDTLRAHSFQGTSNILLNITFVFSFVALQHGV